MEVLVLRLSALSMCVRRQLTEGGKREKGEE